MPECQRCGYDWPKRTKDPKKCPNCGSRIWKKPREEEPLDD